MSDDQSKDPDCIPQEISSETLKEEIEKILKNADLSKTSTKKVIQELEKKLDVQLRPRQAEIDKIIMDQINSMGSEDEKEDASEDETDDSDSDEKPWKTCSSGATKGKGTDFTPVYKLSPQLSEIMGADEMPRHAVFKRICDLVKEKQLYDPNNKQFAICDDALFKVIGKQRFRVFGMMKYLKTHFIIAHKVRNMSDDQSKDPDSIPNMPEEISSKTLKEEIETEKCKDDWRKLRNSYVNAMKRRKNKKRGQATKSITPWKYEEQMSMLQPYMESQSDDIIHLEELQDNTQPDSRSATPLSSSSQSSRPSKNKTNCHDLYDLMKSSHDLLQKQLSKQRDMDESDLFYLSMSQAAKKLPQIDQRKIKLDLHTTIAQFEIRQCYRHRPKSAEHQ